MLDFIDGGLEIDRLAVARSHELNVVVKVLEYRDGLSAGKEDRNDKWESEHVWA